MARARRTGIGTGTITRRELLALGFAAAGASICVPAFGGGQASVSALDLSSRKGIIPSSGLASVGELRAADANGLRLPAGFRSRIVARSRQRPVADRDFAWHDAPDGGATFAAPGGGWIYVSNSEVVRGRGGGASALRFAPNGDVIDAYPVLRGTTGNCAGGPTPWGTWLSCEEHPEGLVWECDPSGAVAAVALPALGAFDHEAVAVDPRTLQLYLTEDRPDGHWYRFTPARAVNGRADLSRGKLEVAEVAGSDGRVRWHEVPDPSGAAGPTRRQVAAGTPFRGGEGCWHAAGLVYFTTKYDNRVWAFDIARQRLWVIYDVKLSENPLLHDVDNVVTAPRGEVLVAEDNGDMQIVALSANGATTPIVQVEGHRTSEVAGPAFDPSGTRLYFSSQRGASGDNGDGVTYEVSGPFGARSGFRG